MRCQYARRCSQALAFSRRQVSALAALLTAGCAASTGPMARVPPPEVACCASLAERGVERLAALDDLRFEIEEGTPSFAFETGQSPFRTFQLPEGGPYALRLSSYVIGDPPTWAVFFPVVWVLDAQRRPVRSLGAEAFHWDSATPGETPGWRKKLEASFQAGGPDERFLIVYTTDALLAHPTVVEMPNTSYVVAAGVPVPVPLGTHGVAVPNARSGKLRIRVAVP
jgi:maltose operon periplasmic protein